LALRGDFFPPFPVLGVAAFLAGEAFLADLGVLALVSSLAGDFPFLGLAFDFLEAAGDEALPVGAFLFLDGFSSAAGASSFSAVAADFLGDFLLPDAGAFFPLAGDFPFFWVKQQLRILF